MSNSANRIRATETIRSWNENFRIGQVVILDGKSTVTESHAGLGQHYEPVVFVEGIEEPVPLQRLSVIGYKTVNAKRRNSKP